MVDHRGQLFIFGQFIHDFPIHLPYYLAHQFFSFRIKFGLGISNFAFSLDLIFRLRITRAFGFSSFVVYQVDLLLPVLLALMRMGKPNLLVTEFGLLNMSNIFRLRQDLPSNLLLLPSLLTRLLNLRRLLIILRMQTLLMIRYILVTVMLT